MTQQGACGRLAFISVRLVTMDHYMSTPTEGLDAVYSSFRSSVVSKVPVLRVFGPTLAGQKTCLHLHGIFPYFYVPKPLDAPYSFVYQLAASIDVALNISLSGEGWGNRRLTHCFHVYKIVEVKGRPFYGYHAKEHQFLKIYLYNPSMVKRTAEILQSGAIMGRVLQPHYSHIPFTLQFMMDYNLQGMNSIHLSHCLFRSNDQTRDGSSFDGVWNSPTDDPKQRRFDALNMPKELLVPELLKRTSTTDLEVDAVAPDILNSNAELAGTVVSQVSVRRERIVNPGLNALWQDEAMHRIQMNIEEPLTPPGSPPRSRDDDFETDSQKRWAGLFEEALKRLKLEGGVENQGKPDGKNDPGATAHFVAAAEAADDSILPSATTVEDHVTSLSQSMLGSFLGTPSAASNKERTDEPEKREDHEEEKKKKGFFDQTIVDEALCLSLLSVESHKSPNDDEALLVDLLSELRDEGEGRASQSQRTRESRSPSPESMSQANFLDEQDDLEMSQICFDSDPFLALDPEFGRIQVELQERQGRRENHPSINASIEWESDATRLSQSDTAVVDGNPDYAP